MILPLYHFQSPPQKTRNRLPMVLWSPSGVSHGGLSTHAGFSTSGSGSGGRPPLMRRLSFGSGFGAGCCLSSLRCRLDCGSSAAARSLAPPSASSLLLLCSTGMLRFGAAAFAGDLPPRGVPSSSFLKRVRE